MPYDFMRVVHPCRVHPNLIKMVNSGRIGLLIIKEFFDSREPKEWIKDYGVPVEQDMYKDIAVPVGGDDDTESDHVWSSEIMPYHHDRGYSKDIHKLVALYCISAPRGSGRTSFVDMQKAYNDAPEELKQKCEGVSCVNSIKRYMSQEKYPFTFKNERDERAFIMLAKTKHDLVWEDKYGKFFFYSPAYTECDFGEEIEKACIKEENTYTHEWTMGDLLLYNNLKIIHAREDTDPSVKRRLIRFALN